MRQRIWMPLACAGLLGAAAWSWPRGDSIVTGEPRHASTEGRGAALAEVRRSCDVTALDEFIEIQRGLTDGSESGEAWRVLADAYLERALTRCVRRGMAIGRPVFDELPGPIRQDLDLGAAALDRARAAGDASSDSYRIEAALTSCRVTGITSAIKHDGAVRQALETAARIDASNPRVLVAVGCRKLFTPALLGGDPAAAKQDLLQAAEALPRDERPLLYAAMAAWASGSLEEATQLARRAAAQNPRNPYAKAVAARLVAGEADPFGRDVEAAELKNR